MSFNKFIKEKLHIFETLQKLFAKFIFLVHFNSDQQLYINVNIFKQYRFNAVIYYVDNNSTDDLFNKVIKFLC